MTLDEEPAENQTAAIRPSRGGWLPVSRECFRDLVLTDLWYKLLAFVVLTPLLGLLVRCLLWAAGKSVLSDLDIAWFLAGPAGWACAIVAGSVWLGITALELTSLLAILGNAAAGRRMRVLSALRCAAQLAPTVLRLAGRWLALVGILLVPFIAIAGVTYATLLGEFDINYYLDERPPEFRLAVGIGIGLVVVLGGVLLHFASGWFVALPLLLFDRRSPRDALLQGRRLIHGHRRRAALWLAGLALGGLLLHALLGGILALAARFLIPTEVGSLTFLAACLGVMLALTAIASLAVNVAMALGLATLMFTAYRRWSPDAEAALAALVATASAEDRSQISWTRPRLAAVSIVGLLLAMLMGAWAIESLQVEDQVLVMAHRGASHDAPENTLAAIRGAIEARADWVEIDVQETADGEVVVLHDSDFMKLARTDLKIWNATRADLDRIDIGSWFDPKFSAERIPTLAQVLDLCKGKIGVVIELKYYGHDQQLESRVAELVDARGMGQQVMVMSLKPEGVRKMKQLRPGWKCGVLMSVAVGDVRKLEADFLAVNGKFVTPALVRRAHAAGRQVFVWTVNDAASLSQFASRGVDGLLTDRPDLARSVLRQREELNSSERLLLEIASRLGRKVELGEM